MSDNVITSFAPCMLTSRSLVYSDRWQSASANQGNFLMSETNKAIVHGSVAAATAAEKRSIQMKHFRDAETIGKCVTEQESYALGQIVGFCVDVVDRKSTLPDGTESNSLLMMGDFEAITYKTGASMTASGFYAPGYFAEVMKSALKNNPGGIAFAIEILVEPTGKGIMAGTPPAFIAGIPYAYAVKRLTARRADNPIEQMKRELAKLGTLRLSPATAASSAEITFDAETGEVDSSPAGHEKTAGVDPSPATHENAADIDPTPAAHTGKGKPKA